MRAGGLHRPAEGRGIRPKSRPIGGAPRTYRRDFDVGSFHFAACGSGHDRMTTISPPRPLPSAERLGRKETSSMPRDVRLALYRSMLKIRRVEDRIKDLYPQGDMRCPTHFSIGQEAVAAGVCRHLRAEDHVVSAHRSHAHYIGKGGSLAAMFAELYGKVDG